MNADLDHWAGARNSMRRFERTGVAISLPWLAGAGALAAAVMLFIVLGVLLNISLVRLRDSFRWTQHGDTILLRIDGIKQSLFQAESNTRAFALTEDAANAAALSANWADWRVQEKALRLLVADNAPQQRRLDRLVPIVEARFARMAWFVRLDAASRRSLIALAARNSVQLRAQQRRVESDIDARLAAFRASELELLQSRRAFAERDSTALDYLSILIALIAPLCGVAGFYLLFRERHHRQAREMQRELIHTQRLALMGETASMLAHEVNQPLAAATNYLSVLSRLVGNLETARPESLKDLTQKAAEQIGRAVSIVQRLRNFMAKRDFERAAQSPALLVADAVALFATLSMTVRLQTHVEAGLPDLSIDRVQIQQVLVNLMRNALEAMQGSARRELALEVAQAGHGTVRFCLRDTGPGLAEEVAARLFRPFVSTKTEGMGVGLSICQKIVTDHGGRIWAEPAEGGGTVFCFVLPADQAATAKAA